VGWSEAISLPHPLKCLGRNGWVEGWGNSPENQVLRPAAGPHPENPYPDISFFLAKMLHPSTQLLIMKDLSGVEQQKGVEQLPHPMIRSPWSDRLMESLIGKRFGRWLVQDVCAIRGARRRMYWLCRCDCGTDKEVLGASLKNGDSTGCTNCQEYGGRRGRRSMSDFEAAVKRMWSAYRNNAPRRSYEFLLSEGEFRGLITQPCGYCGRLSEELYASYAGYKAVAINGLDRVDSSRGYVLDNVVPCCKDCNYMKRRYSVEDFFAHVKRIVDYINQPVFKSQDRDSAAAPAI
jgi:hypothetical protein